MNYLRYVCLAGLLTGLFSTSLFADENWGLCRIPAYYPVDQTDDESFNTEVESNYLIRDERKFLTFSGDVELKRGDQSIQADRIIFDENSEQLQASGTVVFEKPDFRLNSQSLNFDQSTDSGVIDNPEFEMRNRHGRGRAAKVEILDENRSLFSDLLYTSCDPGDRDWHFTSNELEIDDESGLGTAKHATIYFQDIPFFYLPYFQFPIDDRRMSGVLTPTFNITDSDNSHLAVPIYWNIAPNFDTTFTPAWYTERGLLYNSEHRYLFAHNRGQIDYARIEDKVDDDTRWFKRWKHRSDLGLNLSGNLLLQEVSDDDYFSDFDKLAPGSDDINHLDRHLRLNHSGEYWNSALLWQNYQTVDSNIAITSRPYQRLPRLTVNSRFQPWENGLHFGLQNELVRFKRESSVTGTRGHVVPSLSWDSSDAWYFFKPQLQYALTEYSLDNNNLGDNELSRSLPIASIDSGLIFERITGPNNGWLQTLEPRLYFVHIPFEDQSDIPDFDASVLPESYSNFFKPNRFLGVDRIGDTDQVTFGLGTRLYDNNNGDELLYARIAQIYYADDRLVSLGSSIDERDRSNIISAIDIYPTAHLKIGAELLYDEELEEVTEKEFSLNWAKDGFAFNLGYFFDDETLEQSLLSIVYPVNERWSVFAKYHESQLFDKPVENLLGLSYESCCWGLKILASQVSDDDFVETDRALFFELTLKGLTQTGKDVDGYLRRVIPGYQSNF